MNTLNNVPSQGTFGQAIEKVNENFSLLQEAIGEIADLLTLDVGYFSTVSELESAYPRPVKGMSVTVGTQFEIYRCETEGVWSATGEKTRYTQQVVTSLPSNPDAHTIYGLQGTGSWTEQVYSNGSWVVLATHSGAIPEITVDTTPTEGSTNPVQSGGVYEVCKNLILYRLAWNEKSYIDLQGVLQNFPSGGFSTTDFIEVISGYTYSLDGKPTTAGSANAVSFYDSGYNYISGLHYSSSTTWNKFALTFPSGTKYIRLCRSDANDYTLFIDNAAYAYSIQKYEELNNALNNVGDNILAEYLPQFDILKSYISKTDGSITSTTSDDFSVSEKFYITGGKRIVIDGKIIGGAVYGIAYYSSNGTCLGGVEAGTYSKTEVQTPLNTSYIRFCKTSGSVQYYCNIADVIYNIQYSAEHSGEITDLQQYINGHCVAQIPEGTYTIDSPLTIPSGTRLIGVVGRTIIQLGNALSCIRLVTRNDITIEGITFVGNSEITRVDISLDDVKNRVGEGTKCGIYMEGTIKNVLIRNCRFKNFDLAGVQAYMTSGDLTECYKISDCVFNNNWYGLLSDIRSEFNTIVGCSFNFNEIGAFIAGGNNAFSCCHFDKNGVGCVVSGTQQNNDSHGVISASTINHNLSASLYCVDVNNGFVFSGCNIFDGNIHIQNCKGLNFTCCIIAAGITQTSPRTSSANLIGNSTFIKSNGGGTISDTTYLLLKNNYFADGSSSESINN